jgi:protein-tyrosine phosphatase
MRHTVNTRGVASRYVIDSCGTHDYHVGGKSDIRAVQAAKSRGVDMGDIRARQITKNDFNDFDYIVAMDRGHLRILNSIAPRNHSAELSLFLDHSDQKIKDVPDPYYGNLERFEDVLNVLEAGLTDFITFVDSQ